MKYAIIRISYPFGNYDSDKDFLVKTLKYIKSGVAFFSDQIFTPTHVLDLVKVIAILINLRKECIYHIICTGVTTPEQLAFLYVKKNLNLKNEIRPQRLSEFLREQRSIADPYMEAY